MARQAQRIPDPPVEKEKPKESQEGEKMEEDPPGSPIVNEVAQEQSENEWTRQNFFPFLTS